MNKPYSNITPLFVLLALLLAAPMVNAQNYWLGVTSNWHTSTNWSQSSVPNAATHVIIDPSHMAPQGVMPVISNSSAVAEKLEIKNGATLTVQRTLSIVTNTNAAPYHTFIVDGTINVTSTITVTSNLTTGTSDAIRIPLGSVATFNLGSAGLIRVTASSSNGIHNEGTVVANGNGRIQLQSSTLSSIFNNHNNAVFINNLSAPGKLECRGVTGSDGIDNNLGTFTNAGELVIFDVRDSGITNRVGAKKFTNTSTGNILLYRTSIPLANNTAITVNNTFHNAGKITIGRANDSRLFFYGFSLSDSLINTGTIIVENVGTKSICEHCSQDIQTPTHLPVLVNTRDNNTCAANSATIPNTNFKQGYIILKKDSYLNTIDNQGVLLIQYNVPLLVPVTNLKNTGVVAYLDNEFSTSVSSYTVNQGLVISMSRVGCGEGYIPDVSETTPPGVPNFVLDSLILRSAPYSKLAIYDGTDGRMYYTSNLPTGSYQAYLVLHPSICPTEKIFIPYSFDIQNPINWILDTESAITASSNDGKANAHAITNNGNTYNYTWDNGSSGNSVNTYNPFAHSVTVEDNNKCSASKTFYVGDKSTCDVPTLTATVIDTCSGGNLTLNASITLDTGCTLLATNGYLWTFVDFYTGDTTTFPSSSSTRTITGTNAGSWSVQAVIVEISAGSCACSGTGAATPTAFSNSISIKPTPPTPVINNNLPLTVCLGNSISLSVTNAPSYLSGTNFLWYNAANNLIGFGPNYSLTVNTLSPVVLSIVATYNGCSSTPVLVTIYPNALPDAPALSATTYCIGGATTLTNSNTQSNYLTDWYLNPFGAPIGSGNSIVMNNPGANTIVYAVNTNTSTFCKSGFSTITLSPAATPSAPIVISNPLNACIGNTVLLWAKSSSPGTIRWYDNISSNTPIAQSGVTAANDTSFYNYTVTTSGNKIFYVSFINPATGCESPRVPITINTPVVNTPQIVANRTNLCIGETTTLSAFGGSGSYIWYGPDVTQISTGASIQIQGTIDDTLYYYVTSEINGCTGNFDTTRIIVRPDPSFVLVDVNNACFNACNGSIQIGVNQSPIIYNWSNIGLNNISSINNLCPGNYSVTVNNTWGCNVDTSLNVSQTGPFSIQGMVDPISCHNEDDGSINIQVNSAYSNTYVYLWNNGESSNSIDDLEPGNYVVTVTDANGCSVTSNYNIFEPAPLNVFVNTTAVSCYGGNDGQATAIVNGGTTTYTYTWNKLSSPYTFGYSAPNSVNNLTQGSYRVIVSDGHGCLDTALFSVSVPSQLEASIQLSSPIACHGDHTGALQVVTWGGTAPYSYSWSDGIFTSSPLRTSLQSGSYTVLVSDANNCSMSYSYTLTEPQELFANIIQDTVNQCSGASANIFGQGYGGTAPYNFQWQNGATGNNSLVQLGASQNYWLRVTDINQCSVYDTSYVRIVALPSIELGPAISSCPGQQHTLSNLVNTSNVQYNWSTGQTSNSITVSPENSQFYSLTITDFTYGCSASDNVQINIINTLSIQVNSISHVSCFGLSNGSIDISVTGGTAPYAYQWINGSTTQDQSGLNPGLYLVEVTDANGCRGEAIVTVNSPSALQSSMSVANPNCFNACNGTATVSSTGGSGAHTYTWSNGTTNSVASGLCPGIYTVTVNDQHGCSAVNFGIISQGPNLDVSYTSVSTSCSNNDGLVIVNTSNISTPYYISTNAGLISGDSIKFLPAGLVTVTVTDFNGCSRTDIISINNGCNCNVQLSLSVNGISCFGMSDASVQLNANGGTSPYQFSVNQQVPVLDSLFNNLSPGNYSFTAIDINGCSATSTINIPNKQALFGYLNTTNIECSGNNNGQIQASVTGGTPPYAYSINNGITWSVSSTFSSLAAGNYTITIKDANNCELSLNTLISSPSPISSTALLASAPLCYGDSNAIAFISINGGTAPFSLSWSDGVITPNQLRSNLYAGSHSVTVTDDNGCVSSTSIIIQSPTLLTASIVGDTLYKCPGIPRAISVIVYGGVGPYNYNWTDGQTSPSTQLFSNSNQAYWVNVTDANGCQAIDTAQVVVQPLPPLELGPDVFLCRGQSHLVFNQLDQNQLIYNWSTGSNNDTLTAIAIGSQIYTVTATDNTTGCTATDNITISVSNNLTASVDTIALPSCFGLSDGFINISTSGGNATLNYTWSNGITTQNAPNLGSGTYQVIVSDINGCTANLVVSLGQPDPITLSTALTPVTCFANCNGVISAAATGGTGILNYLWGNGSIGQSLNNLCAGTYALSVVDENGCSENIQLYLQEPAPIYANLIPFNATCSGQTNGRIEIYATGGVPPLVYSINGGNSWTSTNILTNLAPGTYTVTIKDNNNCTASQNTTINAPSAISAVVTLIQEPLCHGDSNALAIVNVFGGIAPFNFAWNDGYLTTSPSRANLYTGVHSVTVTDANACTAIASVSVQAPNPLIANIQTDTVYQCIGTPAQLQVFGSGGVGQYIYTWQGGETDAYIQRIFSSSQLYQVSLTDLNGCSSSDSVYVVVLSNPNINIGTDTSICAGQAITIINLLDQAQYTYQWSNGASTDSINVVLLNNTTISATATDSHTGCSTSDNINILISNDLVINIDTIIKPSCFGYSDGIVNLSVSGGNGNYTYSWTNGAITQDLTGLSAGLYIVQVNDSNGCSTNIAAYVGQATPLNLSTTTLPPSCPGTCDGEITAFASGGTGNLSYTWNNGSTSATISSICAATYTLTITDQNNCTATTTSILSQPTPPNFVYEVNPTSCAGNDGTIIISNSNPSSTYTITSTQGTVAGNIISNLSPGLVNITVTQANGCSFVTPITITDSCICTISLGYEIMPITCFDAADAVVTLFSSGGNNTVLYGINQQSPSTNNIFSGLDAGNYIFTAIDSNGCSASQSVTVLEPQALFAYVNPIELNCFNDTTGVIEVFAVGGSNPYSYSINNGSSWTSNNVFDSLIAGTYTIIVKDVLGCQISLNTSINEPAQIANALIVDNPTCTANDGSITFISTGGVTPYTYSLNGITQANPTYNNLYGGTYYYTITDSRGCTLSGNIILNPLNSFLAQINGLNSACVGTSRVYTAQASNGLAPFNFSWSTGQTTNTINLPINANTILQVYVTDANGCRDTASMAISALNNPSLATSPNLQICAGQSTVLSVTGASTYLWNNGNTTSSQVVNPTQSTTYTVTGTNSAGCSSTRTIQITVAANPTANISGQNSICPGSTAILVANTASSYLWSNGATTQTIAVSPSSSQAFQVTVTNSQGCTATATQVVSISPIPSITVNGDTTLCEGDDLSLFINTPGFYSWHKNGNPIGNSASIYYPNASNTLSGLYTVTFTDANGCSTTAQRQVSVSPLPPAQIVAQGATTICNGDSVLLVSFPGQIGNTYLWSNGETTRTLYAYNSGFYTITITNSNGCSNDATIFIFARPSPPAPIALDTNSCSGQNILLQASSGGNLLFWYNNSNNIVGTGPIYATTPTLPGSYSYFLDALDAYGCRSTRDTLQLTVAAPPAPAIVPNATICNGNTASLIVTNPTFGVAYDWSSNGNAIATNAITINVGPLFNNAIIEILATDTSSGCSSLSNANIAIDDIISSPQVNNNVLNTCFNATESIIAFGSSSPNHVLQWYINNILIQTASNSSTDTLILTGLTASTSIEIYEYDTLTLCSSLPRYVNIVVNPALAQPLLIPSTTTICQGSATTVQVNNPGNQTGQVAWYYAGSILSYGSSFNVSNSISNTPGNYTFLFRLENGQCASNFDSVTITVNPTPSINTAIGDTICNGELANLRILGNQGSIAWYLDPNGLSMVGSGNPISIPAFATTLYYARESLNGCLSNLYPVPVIVENLPAAPFLTGGTACEGQAIELTATGNGTDILVWEDFNNQIVQTDTGIVVSTYVVSSTLPAGLYNYHVHQLSLNGCISLPTSTTVQITARPAVPVVADSTICAGSAISLFNSNPTGITRWYSDPGLTNLLASGNSFNVLSLTNSTTYYATNLDAGCESHADTVNITVLPNPVLSISDFTTTPICAGTQALVAAVAPGNYTWYADPSGLSVLGSGISYNTQTLYQNSNFYVQSTVGNCRSNILPVPVTVNQPPTVPVPLNASVCQGESATLQVFVPNAADITWFNAANMIIGIDTNTTNGNLIIPDTLSPGTYTFYANQSNNVCISGLATVSLIVLPPSASPPSDTIVICHQTSTTLAAPNGAFTYEWFDLNDNLLQVGPTFTSPLITDTVNYYLTATPNGGCTSLPAVYQVQARPSIGINNASSNGPVCVGDTLRLFAGTTIPNATYTWTGPAGYTANTENPVISYASANLSGIFIVAATSAEGCTESDTILVQVNQVISSAGIFGNNQICNGFDLGLLCNDLGSGATYTWFLPDGTDSTTAQPNFFIPAVNQSNTGFYGVAINFNGCTSTEDSMFVNVIPRPAPPLISGDTSYCAGEHLILNTVNIPSTVINWILPNGSIRSFVNRIDIDPVNLSDDGIYRIYYFDGTCPSDTAFVNVNVNALPDTSLVTISTNGPLCDGDTLRISASNIPSNVVYSWTDPLSNIYPDSVVVIPNATGLVNLGNYNFYMMSLNGCTSPSISEYVFIAGPPELNFVRSTVHACEGFSFQLFADTSEFVTYSWNGPNGFSSNLRNPIVDSATVNMSGTYTVQAFRGTCASPIYSTIMSVTANPVITTLSNDTLEIEVGTPFELDASGGLIYEWSPPFYLNAVSIPNPTVLADTLDFVSYVVTGYDNQFCSSTDTLHVQFIPARKGEGVDLNIFTIMTPNGDGFNDTWNIGNIQNLENYTISIFDRRGIELYQTDFYQNDWDGTFNGKPLPEGTYWYIIRTPIREYKGAFTLLR